ncbi:TetR family transcriptional regulator [Saccharopolyspora sp. NPDC047091]|uniref:TetR/AcrR family transcriptional regulator n=1 Tax=Saccharopolyspora sp. NPDC047091 TaxID=3155924 RepID=UPI0033D474C0
MVTKRDPDREPTPTERVRREQLIDVTIDLIAANGHQGTSLAGIAAAAGITKAAVLYHFTAKDALVRAAHETVLAALDREVAAAVDAAGAADGPAAYVRATLGHLRDHPRHARLVVEADGIGGAERTPRERWTPLADIAAAAARARGTTVDARTAAIALGGAIDAILTERLHAPDYDTTEAAEQLAGMIRAVLDC